MKCTFIVQNNRYCLKKKKKKMKIERESAGNFLDSVFILSIKYLMA